MRLRCRCCVPTRLCVFSSIQLRMGVCVCGCPTGLAEGGMCNKAPNSGKLDSMSSNADSSLDQVDAHEQGSIYMYTYIHIMYIHVHTQTYVWTPDKPVPLAV